MIDAMKWEKIIDLLVLKTRQGLLNWKQWKDEETTFAVEFSGSIITMRESYYSFTFELLNLSNTVIDVKVVERLKEETQEDGLYSLIREQVFEISSLLDSISKELTKKKVKE